MALIDLRSNMTRKTIQRGKRPKGTPKVDIRDEHLTAKLAHHVLLFIYTGQLTEEISGVQLIEQLICLTVK